MFPPSPARHPGAVPALVAAAILFAARAGADGPYWNVSTFNAANLGATGNHAMWSGVPSGTAGYATAPGYGNNWDDRLIWRGTAPSATMPTTVRLRFVFNHDLQPAADFFLVEYQSGSGFTARATISGSNKNGMGQFIAPATFDQTWTITPAQYGGPHNDQVVLRLRVVTNGSGSDQDGAYNSSGAVQVDNIQIDLNGTPASLANFETSGGSGGWTASDRQAVAEYVRDNILGGSYGGRNLWMTQLPLDQTHVARDRNPQVPDLAMPYAKTWFVVIDDFPLANWAHACRWVAVRADLGAHVGPLNKQMPATLWSGSGSGAQVGLSCAGVTPAACPSLDVPPSVGGIVPAGEAPCRHAVIIEGGVSDEFNFGRYYTNVRSMYRTLREQGYEKANIHVFFEDGSSRDFDNLDGDNDHDTGNDVEGAADHDLIRDRVSGLCDTLDPRRDVLFIYTTDHGVIGGELELWDFSGNGITELAEQLQPPELAADTRDCRVSRLFVLMDQCYSGAFVPLMSDATHPNTVIYTAATADETSWDREYMNVWEDLDVSGLTMNELHAAVIASGNVAHSTPVTAEGSPGIGDAFCGACSPLELCYLPDVTPFCSGDASREVGLVICNLRDEDHTYDIAFTGDAADAAAGCTIAGPAGFAVLDPTPVDVPAGSCARVRVRIDRPAAMDAMLETGCYHATVTDLERGNSFSCHGSVVDQRMLCPGSDVGMDPMAMGVGEPRIVRLRLTSPTSGPAANGAQALLPYQIVVTPSEAPQIPNTIVGLNGLPPGTPVTGSIQIPPPGATVEIPVTVRHLQSDPDFFHDLRLVADVDGNGQQETLITLGTRQSTIQGADATPAPPARMRVALRPNPLRGSGEITFSIGYDALVRLEVLDVNGRRVRVIHRGTWLPAGAHRVPWDGTDDAGHALPVGIYLVRLVTPHESRSEKLVLLD